MNTMSRSFLQIRIIYAFTTLFLVALSVYTFIQIKNLTDSYELISHTNQVTRSLQSILTDIIQAEDSKRGFLLSGETSQLQDRNLSLSKMALEYNLLSQLINDNPVQQNNLKLLSIRIGEKVASVMNLPHQTNQTLHDFETKQNTHVGVLTMQNVINQINLMTATESALLVHRKKYYNQITLITPLFLIFLFLGALIILWASYLKITSALSASEVLQQVLIIENQEKEKRAAELIIANKKLNYESTEKENRAAELVIANEELAFQIIEKEKRAQELIATNKELQLFAQIASHDLQEPLRKIQIFSSRIKEKDLINISESGKSHFAIIEDAAERMQILIQDLISYAQTNDQERAFEDTNLSKIILEVVEELSEVILEKGATIEVENECFAFIIPFQFRQLMLNLITNSLKFTKQGIPCKIIVRSCIENEDLTFGPLTLKKYCHINFSDNGIGFDPIYNVKIFEVFQRLHGKGIYKGTGIGLAIVKKIIDNHKGIITAVGKPNEGATFDIYLPTN